MRTFALLLALASSSTALADTTMCAAGQCPALQDAIADALADAGLQRLDGYALSVDAAGAPRLTVSSDDLLGLRALAARTGGRMARIDTTRATVTIPFHHEDAGLVLQAPGGGPVVVGLLLPAVQTAREVASDASPCAEVCVCTEDGVECWTQC